MTTSLSTVRDQFAALCRIATPTAGRIIKASDNYSIISQWGSRSPAMKKTLKHTQVAFLTSKFEVISTMRNPIPDTESQATTYSDDGKVSAVFATITAENGKDKKYYVRIVDEVNHSDKNMFNLSAKKAHGAVHLSGDFGGAVFSPSGKYILYTAEREHKPVEFFEAELDKPAETEKKDDKKPEIGEKFLWKETFGEQTFEVNEPVLCLLNVENGEIKVLDSIPEHLKPVKKVFSHDESSIYFVAKETPYYRLGHVFCTNRPCTIGRVNLSDYQYSSIAENLPGVDYLMQAHDGNLYGICRSNNKNSHQGPYSFFKVDPTSVNNAIEKYAHDEVYLPLISSRCFTSDGFIVFTGVFGCFLKVYLFNTKDKKLTCLSPADVCDTVLDVFDDIILIQRLNISKAPELYIGKLENEKVTWNLISKSHPYQVPYTCEDVNTCDKYGSLSFVYLPKKSSTNIPLVAFIHGGPHSVSFKTWPRRITHLLLESGFAVLQINYPGSIGYGEEYLQQLPGKIGDVDVECCEKTIADTLAKFSQLDKSKVMLLGGSHGGFLVTHLAGKQPENYKAVVSINPVLDVRTMFDITDIPDWCMYEANLGTLNYGKPMDAEMEKAMIEKSPMRHAHAIRAPYLLAIGGKDLRVAPHFKSFVRHLATNKVEYKVLYYPESNHSLTEVDVDADIEINTFLWFQKYAI